MELSLHANATTTPKVRAYIQRSRKPVTDLAIELGVSETTIRRWRERTSVNDRSHAPKTLTTSLSALEEALVCELRTKLQLPLDDITEVMRRCVNAKLSRSAIHRCLKRHSLSRRPQPDKPAVGVFEQATVGFIHVDLKHLPALQRRRSYAFVPSTAPRATSIWRSSQGAMPTPPQDPRRSSPTFRIACTPERQRQRARRRDDMKDKQRRNYGRQRKIGSETSTTKNTAEQAQRQQTDGW